MYIFFLLNLKAKKSLLFHDSHPLHGLIPQGHIVLGRAANLRASEETLVLVAYPLLDQIRLFLDVGC
jgi:hypothetical protein